MNICTQLIENIQGFLDTSAALNEDNMITLATEYIEACNELNEELKLCAKELHSGNPSEAIRLSEALNVLDNYQLLNMENRDDWTTSIEMVMDVPVPDLLSRLAEELFFCREEQLAQSKLLNKHRLLAWRKAPLKERLHVLRELYLLNSNNEGSEGWLEDLKQWETYRCKEILSHEIDKVSSEEDLNPILDELSPDKMHVELPAALSQKIVQFQKVFSQKRIEAQILNLDIELRETLNNISNALDNNNLNEVASLFQQYNSLYNKMAGINSSIDEDLIIYSQNLHSIYIQKSEDAKNKKIFAATLNKFNEFMSSINPSKEQLIMGYSELKRIAETTNQLIPAQTTIKYQRMINQFNQREVTSKITTYLICAVVLFVIVAVIVVLKLVLK